MASLAVGVTPVVNPVGPILFTPATLIKLARNALWLSLIIAQSSLPQITIPPLSDAETDPETDPESQHEDANVDAETEATDTEFLDSSAAVLNNLGDEEEDIQSQQDESSGDITEGKINLVISLLTLC